METVKVLRKKSNQIRGSRHSRFGGTFIITNQKSISGGERVYHKPLAGEHVHSVQLEVGEGKGESGGGGRREGREVVGRGLAGGGVSWNQNFHQMTIIRSRLPLLAYPSIHQRETPPKKNRLKRSSTTDCHVI